MYDVIDGRFIDDSGRCECLAMRNKIANGTTRYLLISHWLRTRSILTADCCASAARIRGDVDSMQACTTARNGIMNAAADDSLVNAR